MPACRRMFNIFHPYDPVAYRVEPPVCKEYLPKRPVIIPYHRGGKRLHIGLQDFKEDFAARSQRVMNHFDSVRTRVLTICQSKSADKLDETDETDDEKDGRSYGSVMMERLTGTRDGRIDPMLQDKTFELPYLQAIGAHTTRECRLRPWIMVILDKTDIAKACLTWLRKCGRHIVDLTWTRICSISKLVLISLLQGFYKSTSG